MIAHGIRISLGKRIGADTASIGAEDFPMIDGLKVTMSGVELRSLLDAKIEQHEQEAARWAHEQTRTSGDESQDTPLVSPQICEYEEERHEWRCRVLTFIRDHVEAGETYRLGSSDLEFGELLPEAPGSDPFFHCCHSCRDDEKEADAGAT
jgi:hypothetical protein